MPKLIPILSYPNSRLHKKAKLVEDVGSLEVQSELDDMLYTLENTARCAGLAATQLDFVEPKSITVLNDYSEKGDQPRYLINPVIIATEGEQYEEEGCMSVFPREVSERVKRPMRVTVRALDRDGNQIEYTAEGFVATLIQHEVDHLNGMVYLQRLSPIKRTRIDEKIRKTIKNKR